MCLIGMCYEGKASRLIGGNVPLLNLPPTQRPCGRPTCYAVHGWMQALALFGHKECSTFTTPGKEDSNRGDPAPEHRCKLDQPACASSSRSHHRRRPCLPWPPPPTQQLLA